MSTEGVVESAPAEDAAPVLEPTAEAEATPDPEEHVEGSITVPEGDASVVMIPLAAATNARAEAKLAKAEAKAAKEALAKIQGEWNQAAPYVEAAKAIWANPQQNQPQQTAPAGPTAEERAELEETARDLDLFKADGTPDLDRAARIHARTTKTAERMAQASVAPIHAQAKVSQAQAVLTTAKSWQDPATKEQADPTILTNLWNRVASQPGGMDTLANPEAAMFIWGQAMNLTRWNKAQGAAPAAAAAPVTPQGAPVFVETSGGASATTLALSGMEKRLAKDLGMSESEYLKAAAKAPRGM